MKKYLSIAFYFLVYKPLDVLADDTILKELIPDKNETDYAKELPTGDLATHFLPRFIDILLKTSYTIAVAVMVYAGILYIKAQGEEEEISKAKDIFIYGVAGFIIISISFAVVQGLIRLDFF